MPAAGRPSKYSTDEERKEAKKEYNRRYKAKRELSVSPSLPSPPRYESDVRTDDELVIQSDSLLSSPSNQLVRELGGQISYLSASPSDQLRRNPTLQQLVRAASHLNHTLQDLPRQLSASPPSLSNQLTQESIPPSQLTQRSIATSCSQDLYDSITVAGVPSASPFSVLQQAPLPKPPRKPVVSCTALVRASGINKSRYTTFSAPAEFIITSGVVNPVGLDFTDTPTTFKRVTRASISSKKQRSVGSLTISQDNFSVIINQRSLGSGTKGDPCVVDNSGSDFQPTSSRKRPPSPILSSSRQLRSTKQSRKSSFSADSHSQKSSSIGEILIKISDDSDSASNFQEKYTKQLPTQTIGENCSVDFPDNITIKVSDQSDSAPKIETVAYKTTRLNRKATKTKQLRQKRYHKHLTTVCKPQPPVNYFNSQIFQILQEKRASEERRKNPAKQSSANAGSCGLSTNNKNGTNLPINRETGDSELAELVVGVEEDSYASDASFRVEGSLGPGLRVNNSNLASNNAQLQPRVESADEDAQMLSDDDFTGQNAARLGHNFVDEMQYTGTNNVSNDAKRSEATTARLLLRKQHPGFILAGEEGLLEAYEPPSPSNYLPSSSESSRHTSPVVSYHDSDTESVESEPGQDIGVVGIAARFLCKQLFNFQGCSETEHQDIADELREELQDGEYKIISPIELAQGGRPRCQDVLYNDEDYLMSGEGAATNQVWQDLYCGTAANSLPKKLSFARGEVKENIKPRTVFDIDSVLAMPTSLAVAKRGILLSFHPPRVLNILNDLHVGLPVINPHTNRACSAPLRDVPHIFLGHPYGQPDFPLYCFFPALYDPQRQTNYLTGDQMSRFMDEILLPAVYFACPSDVLQHLPPSYIKAKLDCGAAGMEARTRMTRTYGRERHLTYAVGYQYLDNIWNKMVEFGKEKGLQDLGEMVLFLNAKNLKLITKCQDPIETFERFMVNWNITCDGTFLQPKFTWIDYGKEVVDEYSVFGYDQNTIDAREKDPVTYLWKRCCLEKLAERAKMGIEKGATISTFYPWALSQDVCNLTITPTAKNPLRKAGLAYSQYYNLLKEIFDAGKVYPFGVGKEGLAVDPRLRQNWHHAGGGSEWSVDCVADGYLKSKSRCFYGLQGSHYKAFGIREEHRVTLRLLTRIGKYAKGMMEGHRVNDGLDTLRPFWVHTSLDIIHYLYANINKFALGFEYTMSLTTKTVVSWEHTRVMVMFLRLLRMSFGGQILSKEAGLWHDEKTGGIWGDKGMVGMGLRDSLKLRGYAWLRDERMDWDRWMFDQRVASRMLFNNNQLKQSYKKRWGNIKCITDQYISFQELAATINRQRGNKRWAMVVLDYISTVCIMEFRKEVWKTIADELNCSDKEECLEGTIPLCYDTLNSRWKHDIMEPYFIRNCNKHYFHPIDRAKYLWLANDGNDRTGWDNKPYREVFDHAFMVVKLLYRDDRISLHPKLWIQRHLIQFLISNWVLPHPIKGKFYQKSKVTRGRSWYMAHHTDAARSGIDRRTIKNWKDPEQWSTGGISIGTYLSGVPEPLFLGTTTMEEILEFGAKDALTSDEIKAWIRERPIWRRN